MRPPSASAQQPLLQEHELRPFDLPPSWDGEPVEWTEPWEYFGFHFCDVAMNACDKCGVVDYPLTKSGIVNGRRRLHASRCRHCHHDTVYDYDTKQAWDLDPTDYGPDGSKHPHKRSQNERQNNEPEPRTSCVQGGIDHLRGRHQRHPRCLSSGWH